MDKTAILKEIRQVEITDKAYNGVSLEEGERFYDTKLQRLYDDFFDDLNYYIANIAPVNKDTVIQYINITIQDLEETKQRAENITYNIVENSTSNDFQLFVKNMSALQLKYIQAMIEKLNSRYKILYSNPLSVLSVENRSERVEDEYSNLLSEYGDLLSISDLCIIFKTTRQTINRWENEGAFKRTDDRNKPLFLKAEIKRFLAKNHPKLAKEYSKQKRE